MSVTLSQEPRPITQKVFMASNVFCLHSRKAPGREVMLLGPALYDAWLLLEFDPEVVAICERPHVDIAIVRSHETRALDFWVARQGYVQHGVIVHGVSRKDKKITLGVLQASLDASMISCQVWPECDLMRRRLQLRNMKQLLPYLSSSGADDAELAESLHRSIQGGTDGGASLDELFRAHPQRHRSQVTACLFNLFHKGRVSADLEHASLTTDTRWQRT